MPTDPRDPPTPDQLAAGWAFALAHSRTIDGIVGRLLSDPRISHDDLRQEAVLGIARAHRGYDPTRSAPATWIWWRVRRARQTLILRLNRIDAHEKPDAVACGPGIVVERSDNGRGIVRAYRLVLVAQAMDAATPDQRAAVHSVLADVPDRLLPAVLGVPAAVRDDRLRALGAALAD